MKTTINHSKNGGPRKAKSAKPPWKIALIANLKADFEPDEDDPPDAGSEFDSQRTIQAISDALQADGHQVTFLSADATLPTALTDLQPDFCFNIAEGLQGDGREAQVPALCELLGIPYTASRVVSSAIGLDKAHTKRVWRDAGLPTAGFVELRQLKDLDHIPFDFPMFVKPAREGSGMGITQGSIVRDYKELQIQAAYILEKYHQPALVEEFLPGREFTVGFIGNPGSPKGRRFPGLYDLEGYHFLPILEIDSGISISPTVYGQQAKSFAVGTSGAPGYLCPADISPDLERLLITLTKQAAEALDVCDVSRVDFRLDNDQQPRLLEINTLPGLSPGYSDLCIQASAEALPYEILITEILYLAAERYNMPTPIPTQGPGVSFPVAAIH
ncbi:MAG: hypothetical protein AB8I40_07390 [Anaerolineales bacterium]